MTNRTPLETNTSGMIRHTVLFQFIEETTPEQLSDIEYGFVDLAKSIEFIQAFEWNRENVGPKERGHGFSAIFVLTFAEKTDIERYINHPEHQQFLSLVNPHLKQSLIFDYFPTAVATD